MKRTYGIRTLCLILVILVVLPLIVACGDDGEIEWHRGIITSASHETPLALIDEYDGYSYSDVIHLPEAGTKLTFTDWNTEDMPDTEWAGEDVLVISHWVEQNGEWVLENPGDHYTGTGGRSKEILKIKRGEYAQYTYISSFDDEYVRLCYKSGHTKKNNRKMEFPEIILEDTNKPGTLVQNSEAYLALKVEKYLVQSKAERYFEQLRGRTVYVMGDSYFDDSDVKPYMWIDLLARKYELTVKNFAKSGSTVSNYVTNHRPMCDRISAMDAGSPDIILFDGGRNDFNLGNAPLGEASLSNRDTRTFRGAVNDCIAQLREKYPGALILGFTCWNHEQTNANGDKQIDFANAMREMCTLNGVPCLFQADEAAMGIYMDDSAFRAKYCKAPNDISHLNPDGMMLYLPKPEQFIAEAYAAFLQSR